MASELEQKHDDELDYWSLVFQHLSDQCNGGDEEAIAEAFAEHMMTEHRTLQQCMVKVMVACLIEYSKQYQINYQSNTDLRNKAAFDFCDQLFHNPPYFPFI